MRKHCLKGCKLRPCLDKESTNLAYMRTIVTAVLQRQYSLTELIFWITLYKQVLFYARVTFPKNVEKNQLYKSNTKYWFKTVFPGV
jgi:hypothetical protein